MEGIRRQTAIVATRLRQATDDGAALLALFQDGAREGRGGKHRQREGNGWEQHGVFRARSLDSEYLAFVASGCLSLEEVGLSLSLSVHKEEEEKKGRGGLADYILPVARVMCDKGEDVSPECGGPSPPKPGSNVRPNRKMGVD